MKLTLYITGKCGTCARVENNLRAFAERQNGIAFTTKLIGETEKDDIFIVPALFINGELYTYGDVDMNKLRSVINRKGL